MQINAMQFAMIVYPFILIYFKAKYRNAIFKKNFEKKFQGDVFGGIDHTTNTTTRTTLPVGVTRAPITTGFPLFCHLSLIRVVRFLMGGDY